MHRITAAALAGGALLAAAAAGAQERPGRDPLDAQAAVPAVRHQPALAGYRRLNEPTPLPWREANDQVDRIGGWRAYAREAAAAARPASAPTQPPTQAPTPSDTSPAAAPAPAHGQHHQHRP